MKYRIEYLTYGNCSGSIESNSRNARKHLEELQAHTVSVYVNRGKYQGLLISHAERYAYLVVSGAIRKGEKI